MPELPEVEVVRQGLAAAVAGATVRSVDVLDERALKRHDGTPLDFVSRLEGCTFLSARRRGKFLWIPLAPTSAADPSVSLAEPSLSSAEPVEAPSIRSATRGAMDLLSSAEPVEAPSIRSATRGATDLLPSADPSLSSAEPVEAPSIRSATRGAIDLLRSAEPVEALLAHLGMSGQMLVRTLGAPEDKQLRIRMRVEGPHGEYEVRFIDQRLFGSLAIDTLVPAIDAESERIPSQAAHIARDPIDPLFDPKLFSLRIRSTKRGIKAALLDQTIISGVGNIYADEALWRARLHGEQPASTVSARKINELLAHVQDVFVQALEEGGTSFDSLYVNVNGESGYFAHSLNAYGRTGEPCPRCGTPIKRVAFANRGSHFCPRCQRKR